ncbi:MAG: DUF4445 domain-containing protein, partial [Dehalococcoidia bacterium]|nr:DUF4445 domain-containing protein [Dehalococcoidia bacterium]
DLVAVLLECGVIDHEGLIRYPRKRAARSLALNIVSRAGAKHFLIASAEESYTEKPIYLTQKDVRELQLSKGAIAAGIQTLMDELGIGVRDISRVYLAGALGNYVDPRSTVRTGLIPAVTPEKIKSLGNAASTGASMVLLSREYWQKAAELTDFVEHIELSSRPDFNDYFVEQMNFPRADALSRCLAGCA